VIAVLRGLAHLYVLEAVTKLKGHRRRWDKLGFSRAATAFISPARQCREGFLDEDDAGQR